MGSAARRLAADGASVLVHSWSAHDARQAWGAGPDGLVEEIRAQGGRAERAPADLADPEAPAQSVTAARKAFGHLDVVVANHSRSSMQNLEQLTATEIGPSYAVNTGATLLLVQAYATQHDGRPGGRVVVSTSGQYHGAMPGELPYIASKGALHELTPSLAVHLAPRASPSTASIPDPTTPGTPTRPPSPP
nr:SDR family NAD(P)-dependent oxidoreductase [Geodermatophilus sp. DSM 45219]